MQVKVDVIPPPRSERTYKVHLELSEEEAKALRSITSNFNASNDMIGYSVLDPQKRVAVRAVMGGPVVPEWLMFNIWSELNAAILGE